MNFLQAYFETYEDGTEVNVLCPFPHKTSNGVDYFEHSPSAHVNMASKVFHCKACGAGHNETSFIQAILGCDLIYANKIIRCFSETNNEDRLQWLRETTVPTPEELEYIKSFGISQQVAEELLLRTVGTQSILFPQFMYDHLLDIRRYNPGTKPKMKARTGGITGYVYPFDLWRITPKNKLTLLCAGEKDMAVARSNGFNAITVIGGEATVVKTLAEFKDRIVAVVYDNDETGRAGAIKIANALHGVAKSVKVVTGFHEVCSGKGEDITDFFVKYGKTKDDLVKYIKETLEFVPTVKEEEDCNLPIVDLLTASKSDNVGKLVRSNIQVVATSEESFLIPTAVLATKLRLAGTNDTMMENATRDWVLTDNNVQDVLHLMDNRFKEETIKDNLKTLMRIPLKEKYVGLKFLTKKTVFKAYITDLFETSTSDLTPMEYTAYALGVKLESGKKYLVTYKIVPHPYAGQRLTMIITNAVQANDSVSNFKVTDTTKEDLQLFQNLTGSVEDRIHSMTECVKGLLGYNGNDTLIQAMDLSYHTVLDFNFGNFKGVRGYLDTLIVGESRMGKSSTADALRKTYELGVFTSLAGNAATVAGLIGGSNKVNGAYQTRAGLIPQNHRGLIIFEEFGKSNSNIITELTDIRSSNEVRITRVSGTITMPAIVRMITLTNVKSIDGQIRPIAAYPHGIAVVTELIGTAEDIARYDLMVVLADRGASQIDPFWTPREPFPKRAYQSRLRWIWSRSTEQIHISQDVAMYIMECANQLNKEFDTHIKVFGTEAWKKITRLSIAVAGYVVSTDDSYENIVVLKEHVDYAVKFFQSVYDNATFKLKEYVQHERQFCTIDDHGVQVLQDLFFKVPSLLLQLEQHAKASRNTLAGATGLTNDDLNKLLTVLTQNLFIRFSNYDIVPTERFRMGMAAINRNTRALRIGERNVT